MKKSELEAAFEKGFKKFFLSAGFSFETQVVIDGARFRYDARLVKGKRKILLEIDGHGMGHNSVASLARDARKGNHAVLSGYEFYRLTTKHFKQKKGKRIPGPYALEWAAAVLARTKAR